MAHPNHKGLYRPARLVIPSPSSKDQRWFIKWWPFSEQKGVHVLKKKYALPEHPNQKIRKQLCLNLCAELDRVVPTSVLAAPQPKNPDQTPIGHLTGTYLKSIHHLRPRSQEIISRAVGRFIQYLETRSMITQAIGSFGQGDARRYQDYLIGLGLANRTVNNEMGYLKRMVYHFMERNPGDLELNPFSGIRKLKQSTGKNTAYTEGQIKEIMALVQDYPDMDFLVKFMYYTLWRTNELSQLQVRHVCYMGRPQIYLPAEVSKNGYERFINIPEPLLDAIYKREITSYPPDYYVFSLAKRRVSNERRHFVPGAVRTPTTRLGERYRTWILDKLDYPKDYTLSSWKHTGVVQAHRHGVSDADIMQQTGHRDYGSFKVYMKSLGLYARGMYAANVPEI